MLILSKWGRIDALLMSVIQTMAWIQNIWWLYIVLLFEYQTSLDPHCTLVSVDNYQFVKIRFEMFLFFKWSCFWTNPRYNFFSPSEQKWQHYCPGLGINFMACCKRNNFEKNVSKKCKNNFREEMSDTNSPSDALMNIFSCWIQQWSQKGTSPVIGWFWWFDIFLRF